MLENYTNFNEDMILRDYLALDRTILANERTFLSYIRTFIGTLSAGIAMLKLMDTVFTNVTGYVFIIASPFFLIFGLFRFFKIMWKIKTIDKKSGSNKNTDAV